MTGHFILECRIWLRFEGYGILIVPVRRGSKRYSHATRGVSLLLCVFRIEEKVREKEEEALCTPSLKITLFEH